MWQPAYDSDRRAYRFLKYAAIAVAVGSLLVVTFGVGFSQTVGAQSDVRLDSLETRNVEHTVNGQLEDVSVSGTIDYQYNVPDATQRTVKLQVGSSENDLETVTFDYDREPPANETERVTLDSSIFESQAFTRSELSPSVASTKTTEVVVRVILEIERENGETVTSQETETVTVTLHDDAELSSAVGGVVTVQVADSG